MNNNNESNFHCRKDFEVPLRNVLDKIERVKAKLRDACHETSVDGVFRQVRLHRRLAVIKIERVSELGIFIPGRIRLRALNATNDRPIAPVPDDDGRHAFAGVFGQIHHTLVDDDDFAEELISKEAGAPVLTLAT